MDAAKKINQAGMNETGRHQFFQLIYTPVLNNVLILI